MSKFLYWSDIHKEFGTGVDPVSFPMPTAECPAGSVDAILIAGDLHNGKDMVETLKDIYEAWRVPVIAIRGNHDQYRHEIKSCRHEQEQLAHRAQREGYDIRILERGVAVIGDTRILGCTLWTDFDIIGNQNDMMFGAAYAIRDYQRILIEEEGVNRNLTPDDVLEMHKRDKEWLLDELDTAWTGKTVVLTHHIPVPEMLAPDSGKGGLAPAYASDMRRDILEHDIDAWVCGHSHWAKRGTLEGLNGRITFLQNMQGYPDESTNFSPYDVLNMRHPDLGLGPLVIDEPELSGLENAGELLARMRLEAMTTEPAL